jgi:hypothetical protein
MVTNYPQEIVARRVPATADATRTGTLLSRLWKHIQFALCGLHGHDPLLQFDEQRIYLRCASCGHETPGWELDQRRPRMRFRGDPARQYLSQRRSFERSARRIA